MEAETQKHRRKWIPARQTWGIRIAILAALLVPALTLAAACGGGDGGGENSLISEGAAAPDFSLPAAGGERVSLSDFAAERNVLLYFSMGSG